MPRKSEKILKLRIGKPGRSHFYNHDDRVPSAEDAKFPSRSRGFSKSHEFKPAYNRIKKLTMAIEEHLDGDVVMGSHKSSNGRRVAFRNRQGIIKSGSSSDRQSTSSGSRPRPLMTGDTSWYKISIPFGSKYDKDYIINNLLSSIAPNTFIPIMYRVIGQEAVFYVDEQKTANQLLSCDRKITTPDNFKISVRVRPGYPNCQIDESLKEKLKLAMAKRYVEANNALDLSCFHHDPDLVGDYFCALFKPAMLGVVLDIVAQAIPNLEALNLDNNKLSALNKLTVLKDKFASLKILYIGDNKIRDMHQIDIIKDLKLNELRLEGNPICNRYRNRRDEYVSDIRKRFPKLLRLDGTELPKPILFDVADEGAKLPPSQRIFAANAKAQEIANQFMQQYFTIFDSDSRQPLLVAYHTEATFSLVVNASPQIQKFNVYLPHNRNLFRTNDTSRRKKLLKQGRLPVVTCLTEMPKTQHYPNTFTMDIALVTDTMMVITVTGIFKEVGTKDEPLRYFDRTFIIVPEGTGYCIKNEQLQLGAPTTSQERQVAEGPTVTFTSEQAAQPIAAPAPVAGSEPTDEVKKNMTMELSRVTNMNLDWSLKCLQEVQWNFDTALAAFNEFFQRGQIPQEAFNNGSEDMELARLLLQEIILFIDTKKKTIHLEFNESAHKQIVYERKHYTPSASTILEL